MSDRLKVYDKKLNELLNKYKTIGEKIAFVEGAAFQIIFEMAKNSKEMKKIKDKLRKTK